MTYCLKRRVLRVWVAPAVAMPCGCSAVDKLIYARVSVTVERSKSLTCTDDRVGTSECRESARVCTLFVETTDEHRVPGEMTESALAPWWRLDTAIVIRTRHHWSIVADSMWVSFCLSESRRNVSNLATSIDAKKNANLSFLNQAARVLEHVDRWCSQRLFQPPSCIQVHGACCTLMATSKTTSCFFFSSIARPSVLHAMHAII